MERGHLPHDLEPSEPTRLELQRQLDEMFERHDIEVARILSQYIQDMRDEVLGDRET